MTEMIWCKGEGRDFPAKEFGEEKDGRRLHKNRTIPHYSDGTLLSGTVVPDLQTVKDRIQKVIDDLGLNLDDARRTRLVEELTGAFLEE
jgi:hypothetical protein